MVAVSSKVSLLGLGLAFLITNLSILYLDIKALWSVLSTIRNFSVREFPMVQIIIRTTMYSVIKQHKIFTQIAPESISEHLKSKFSWGGGPPHSPHWRTNTTWLPPQTGARLNPDYNFGGTLGVLPLGGS